MSLSCEKCYLCNMISGQYDLCLRGMMNCLNLRHGIAHYFDQICKNGFIVERRESMMHGECL